MRINFFSRAVLTTVMLTIFCSQSFARNPPNIILVYSDDISARELSMYGSSRWSGKNGQSISNRNRLAKTPVLDKLAREGVMIQTAWASTICSPSRAMMMTGRYAHLHQWWDNGDYGRDANGRVIPLYRTSPRLIGHIARQGGYDSIWAGKTQMKGADLSRFGFQEGVFTPGEELVGSAGVSRNRFSDFVIDKRRDSSGREIKFNKDTGGRTDTFLQTSWYWQPGVVLMNHPSSRSTYERWPNTARSRATYGVNTYGPDVELDFILDFMERKHNQRKPFFVYHTTHLGHDAFDFLKPNSTDKWPGTPKVRWNGNRYTRTAPNITGDAGVYNTRNTVTKPGINRHIEYLDYQIWQYMKKLRDLGIEDDTVFIFASDNGTSGYGKGSPTKQRGVHVPLVIYAPGLNMTKQGKQNVLASMADILPTIADLASVNIPNSYEVHGESLVPFLTTNKAKHRDYLYSYKGERQLVRGNKVMRDGKGAWWDVSRIPRDLDNYPKITNWNRVSASHRAERDRLNQVLNRFDLYMN